MVYTDSWWREGGTLGGKLRCLDFKFFEDRGPSWNAAA